MELYEQKFLNRPKKPIPLRVTKQDIRYFQALDLCGVLDTRLLAKFFGFNDAESFDYLKDRLLT